MIVRDDFRCLHRGVVKGMLPTEDLPFLQGYEKRGAGKQRALLLLHGFTSSPLVFRYFFPHLDGYDAVIAPTLPGHGTNIAAFTSTQASDWIQAVEHTCACLCQEYAQVDVLGLSLGGVLAHHLSQKFSLNHLYLLAPALDVQRSRLLQRIAQLAYRAGFVRIRNQGGNLYREDDCEITYRQLPLQVTLELFDFIHTYNFRPPGCPTDIFLGAHDNVIDSAKTAERFNTLPNATVHWLKDTAHVIPLDTDRDRVLDVLNR